MKILFFSFVLILGSSFLFAQNTPQVNCDSAYTQLDMNICAEMQFQKADSLLNVSYKQIMDFLNHSIKEAGGEGSEGAAYYKRIKDAVVASQRAWIPLRDANASIPSQVYYMGSIVPLMVSTAKASDTEARTKFLQALLKELQGE